MMTVAIAADARAQLLLDLVKIDNYADFASTGAALPKPLASHVTTMSGRSVDDPELVAAIQRWLAHYAHPIALLRQFRDGLLAGTAVDDRQLTDVAQTAHQILQAVEPRLARLR